MFFRVNKNKIKPVANSARELDKKRIKELSKSKSKKAVSLVPKRKHIPKTALDTLPYHKIADDSIIEVSPGRFSRSYVFSDVNYHIARPEDQEDMFLRYCSILNAFDSTVDIQISIVNSKVNPDFIKTLLLKINNDHLDEFRREMNEILLEKARGQNELKRTKILTISLNASDIDEARSKFLPFDVQLSSNFKELGSKITLLDANQRVNLMKDIFRGVDVTIPVFNVYDFMRGTERSYIAPDYFEFKNDYFMFNDVYARCVFVRDLPSSLADRLISALVDSNFDMVLSINISPLDLGDAVSIVKKQLSAMEQNKLDSQKGAFRSGYSPDIIPLNLKHAIEEATELLDDLQNKNQKMFLVSIVIMHMARSYDQLQQDTDVLKQIARKYLVNIGILKYQQEDAMASCLPIGNNKLKINHALTTESTAIFMPFNTQELFQPNSIYYGVNAVSRNLIMLNRKSLDNPSGFILGSPGSGKSFSAKREMISVLLSTDDDVIIIDPEREYTNIGLNFNGEIVELSASSKHHINPFDMSINYDDNPILLKSEFILSMCDLLTGGLSAIDKTIIDRCLHLTYRDYMHSFDESKIPTLKDFYNILKMQTEPEAQNLALALELYTQGSLSIFANKTNIDVNNRLIIFDIKDLGKQLKTLGMLIVIDWIWNRVSKNRELGKRTWIYTDEFHILCANDLALNFYFELYKRARKWGAIPTGITQNVEDLLLSDIARRMLSNSGFIQLLNQAPSDRMELANLLKISETQLSFVTNSGPGQGLLIYGGSIIPFIDQFPSHSLLYRMMTTKLEEVVNKDR